MIILRKEWNACMLFFAVLSCSAQHNIQGIVLDQKSTPIVGATIVVKGLKKLGVTTDFEGQFVISVPEGSYTLETSYIGFKKSTKTITVSTADPVFLTIVLQEDIEELNSVTVRGKTENEKKRSTGYAINVIEAKELKNIPTDINQVIKSIPGINLREAGGLGSNFKLALNGLAGNQVRYFIDGIPMENFGSSLTLNNFPVNLIKSVEVYKGVVPVSLGSDALGGAINIITEGKKENYVDASYSIGSFNTHRTALNAQYSNAHKNYVKLISFFNYSDNDYLMRDVPLFDLELGNFLGNIDVNRFYDQYTSTMLSAEFGVFDKKYADQWYVRLTSAYNKNEYQHPDNNILRVLGEFNTEGNTILLSTVYEKEIDKLGIKLSGLVGNVKEINDDTSTRKYNWAGDFIERDPSDGLGELGVARSLFRLTDQLINSQANAKYTITDAHSLEGNYTFNYLRRKGKDDINPVNFSFREPSTLSKNIFGVSYTLKSIRYKYDISFFAKQYLFSGKQKNANTEEVTTVDFSDTGYGGVLALNPLSYLTIKASYEKSYRIPESYELLGDGLFILPNFELTPEESDNINIGGRLNTSFSFFSLVYSANVFYRKSIDFIRLKRPEGVFSEYDNITNVTSKGIESGVKASFNNKIEAQFNITYQDIIDKDRLDEGVENAAFDSRVPNIPYFFWNTRMGSKFFKNRLSIYWNYSFTESFFLKTENNGNPLDKNDIPVQHVHGIDIDYNWKQGRYNLSASVTNLTDALVFDNFRIQKPGRALYLKFRYFLQ
ncbi:TonB-dependent receptor [Aquimarina sp. RZ0]|uniref:TonB-dependent receptor n=1 Tax=Aquimarina sp. RZ0 TaxID=2607730 RepID=UPI00210855E7|nr:TonB-dependent receptor [Aquimarina sp. RZ0]